MKQNQARFESFPWEMEILDLEVLFDGIDGFLNDNQVKNIYLRKRRFRDEDTNQILLNGVQTFRRQMVVLLKTYLEQIIKDFSRNVFIGNPEGYLSLDKYKGIKSVKELERTLAENKTIAPNELSQIAAEQVTKGKLSTALNRIEQISKTKIKDDTKGVLVELNKIRTHIVHDASTEEISIAFLHKSFEAVRDLIVSFREACFKNNISDVEEFDETDDWE